MNKLYGSIQTDLIDQELETKIEPETTVEPTFQDIPENLYAAITSNIPEATVDVEAEVSESKTYSYSVPHRLYTLLVPEKPAVLAEERIYVYVPKVSPGVAGIARFAQQQFNVLQGEVSLNQTYLAELLASHTIRPELIIVVNPLPAVGLANHIYLVPLDVTTCAGYIWNIATQTWISIGTVSLDMTNYFTKNETQALITEELNNIMTIINNIQSGIFSLIQVGETEPTDSNISIWFEIESEGI